jgi:predicted pyridoxine 5'-phosphate oxidase superfamily flavin-nucleotide-binding protein
MRPAGGFHLGELTVQRRAGLTEQAARLAGMLAPPDLDGGMGIFIAARGLALVTSRDEDDRIWTSPVFGHPGFCRAHGSTLTVAALPAPGDPLDGLCRGAPAGVLFLDIRRRRRLRVNGSLACVDASGFTVAVDQGFGNCPRYIRQREFDESASADQGPHVVGRSSQLEPAHIAPIRRADTFLLGTAHPTRGADTSHRGGAPGFVRVKDGALWWPDYPGNNLFNSLGNIVEDPATSLVFLDFATGDGLQLSGQAKLDWLRPESPGDDAGTGRRVRFTPERIVATEGLPIVAQAPISPAT